MRKRPLVLIALMIVMAATAVHAAPADGKDLVKASIVADTTAVEPGKPFRVAIQFKITPKWHIYWLNPGDGGIPTTVEFTLPQGFTASEVQYPIPRRFTEAGDIVAFGYENEATLVATITPPATIASKEVSVNADVNWLVCEKVCLTGDAKLSLTLAVGSASPANEAVFAAASKKLPGTVEQADTVADVSQSMSLKSDDKGEYTVVIDWKAGVPQGIEWFAPPSPALFFGRPAVQTDRRRTTITVSFERVAGQPLDADELNSIVAYATGSERGGVLVPVDVKPLQNGK